MNSRYEKAKEKYLSDLDLSVIDQLAYCDPSKDHKYLDWMCDRLILRCWKRDMKSKYLTPGLQYVTDMCKLVKSFHENLPKFTRKNVESSSKGTWYELSDLLKLKKAPKDIYSYSTYQALEFYVNHISSIMSKKDLRDIVHNETGVHYDDGEWKIITPFTTRASNYYGVGTKWCTSAKENNQFETYRVRGELYYIIGKRKVAYFHSHDEEECAWYNDIDNMVHYEDVSDYVPKEILDKVLEIDAEAFEEISLNKNERAYFLRVLRDLVSQSSYVGMDGWRLEFENNGAVWINEKEEKLKLWVNPSHINEEKLDWICVLVDSHFSHMIHSDEWMMWDLDEITERKWIPIDLDLTGDIKKDKMRIVSDFLFHSASMFSELEEFVELYTSNLPLNRQKHLTKVGEAHLGWT